MEPPLRKGIGLALASACLFGLSTPLAKVLVGNINPWLLAGLLYLGCGFGLAVVYLALRLFGMQRAEAPLRWKEWPWLAGVVLFGGLLGPVLLMIGLSHTPASAASLLLNLEGVATVLIAWIVFRENADWRIVAGAVAILGGASVLSCGNGAVTLNAGAFAIAGACVCWGIDNNLTRKLSSADPMMIAMMKGLVAGSVNLILALSQGAHLPNNSLIASAGAVGFLGYGVSLVFFVVALRHLGSARTGAYFALAPFIGALVSILFLHEPVTLRLVIAGLFMGVGLYLHLTERHEHEHAHVDMEHEHRHVHDAHHQHEHLPTDPDGEPHSHPHRHTELVHSHPHYPDLHHRHPHG
jgi:drug/metabolite transporter (DMT)-like permease